MWSGQVVEPADGAAFIGREPGRRHVHVVTGDSGQGMTHAALAGLRLAASLADGEGLWDVYDPGRVPKAIGRLASEGARTNTGYLRWLAPGTTPQGIPVGSGALVRDGLDLRAVYRAAEDRFETLRAKCTHLGCVVAWNGLEKTWDCPCHGSRFATDGAVVCGPAAQPLAKVEDAAVPGHAPRAAAGDPDAPPERGAGVKPS